MTDFFIVPGVEGVNDSSLRMEPPEGSDSYGVSGLPQ